MTIRPRTFALSLALSLLVAGCNKQADGGTAEASTGEVLPGSISDAMIDLDTSTASPPLAPIKEPATKAVASSASEPAQDAEAAAAPAAEPAEAAPAESPDTE